jgi:hemerythrin
MKTMEWIHWDTVLATGHVIFDTDHEHLVALFNQLVASVKERKSKVVCAKLLYKIIQHAQVHFAFEEQLMADQHYPKADQHTAEHARLVKQAVRYMAKFEADAPGSYIPLIHFPEDWLTFHILSADKELAEFLSVTA